MKKAGWKKAPKVKGLERIKRKRKHRSKKGKGPKRMTFHPVWAWARVRANKGAPGIDGQTVGQFERREAENLEKLHQELREKRYRPQAVRRVEIPKSGGGKRALGIPTVRDRIVQQALLQVLSPIFEEEFGLRSHGFRPGRGCETALAVVDQAVRHGYEYVVDADISKFFDNVDHELLLEQVNEEVSDGSVLGLIRAFLKSGVLLGGVEWEPTEKGTPQGGPLSPLLANIYLHPFDKAMQASGLGLVRYADDFVIFARSRERAGEALEIAGGVLEGLKLHLHPEKTRIAAIDGASSFWVIGTCATDRGGCRRWWAASRRGSSGRVSGS